MLLKFLNSLLTTLYFHSYIIFILKYSPKIKCIFIILQLTSIKIKFKNVEFCDLLFNLIISKILL